MTALRDARFKRALETAPDADARPAPAVAQAIRAAARKALPHSVAQPAPRPWWQRLWQRTGSPRAPWGAAFASVLLAVLVTAMWVHEPIPDARPIAPKAPSEAVPAATTAPTTETTAKATKPAMGPAIKDAAHSAASVAVTAPPTARLAKPAPTAPSGAVVEPSTAPADNRAAADIAAEPAAANAQTAASMGLPAQPPTQDQARARGKAYSALAAEGASRDAKLQRAERAAPPPPAPPVPPARVAAASPPAAPEPPPGPGPLDGLESWTSLRVELEGRTVTLNGADGQRLFAAAIQRLAMRAKPLPDPLSAVPRTAPKLRLRILAQGQTLAVMYLWDKTALWRRPGQVDLWTDLAPDEMSDMLQLAHQALAPDAPE